MSKALSHLFATNLIAIKAINTPAIGVFYMDLRVNYTNEELVA